MAKQTQLKNLLQDLERATRTHERANNYSTSPSEKIRLFGEADRAEKRVFSFFDALHTEVEESARAYKSLQEQRNHVVQERDEARKAATDWQNAAQKAKADLQELAQQVMAMKPAEAVPPSREQPAPKQGEFVHVTITVKPNEPFNNARARAGDPIEVMGGDGKWQERKYIGEFVNSAGVHMITFLYADTAQQARASEVRMKPKAPKQLQMFANVWRRTGSSGQVGALYATKDDAVRTAGSDQVVTAAPVTITVAE